MSGASAAHRRLLCAAVIAAAGVVASSPVQSGAAWSPPAPPADTARPAPGRELVGLRTARSRTWQRSDGGRVTRIYERPVNRKIDARWRPVDNELRKLGDGWSNGAAGYSLSIPSTLGAGPISLERGQERVALELRGADVPARVEGQVAEFAGVADGVTARWTSGPSALKEELVLASPEALSSFTFDVSLSDGLRLARRADGAVDVRDTADRLRFAIAAPFAYDAAGRRAPAGAVRTSVERASAGWTIGVSLDRSWLRAAGRAFPVTIDPTIETWPAADCYLDAGTVSTSYCSSPVIAVGRESGHDHRGLLRFDVADVLPPEANVMQARVLAYDLDNIDPTTSRPVEAYRVTADWSDDASWSRRTAIDGWTSPGGDVAADAEDQSPAPVEDEWSDWYVTDLFNGWRDGSVPNQGVLLRSTALSSDGDSGTMFVSSDDPDPYAWPYLEVVWYGRTGAMGDYTIDRQQLTDRQSLGVNVAGGNLLLQADDLQLAGRGMDLNVARAYNSQQDWVGQTGLANRLSIGNDVSLIQCDRRGSLCYAGPTGTQARFRRNADGSYVTPPGVNATLVKERDGSWTMTFHRTGVRFKFFASSDDSFLTDVVDRNNNRIHFDYTSSRLYRITDTQGRQIGVSRNSVRDITEITDPLNRSWRYGYGSGRTLTSVTDPDNRVTGYRYDSADRLDRVTDPRGNATYITYDNAGRVISVRRQVDGTARNDLTTTYTYAGPTSPCSPGSGDVGKTIVVDPRGRDSIYCWNRTGQVSKARDPLGRDTSTRYTPNGDTADYTRFAGTGNAALTSLTYDGDDNLTGSRSPAGESDATTYWSAASNPTDPLRRFRPQSYTDAQGHDQFFGYDTAGNLTDVKDATTGPLNQATLAYNGDGTLRTATDGNGNTTTLGYDVVGNLTSVDPAGPVLATTYTHDTAGRVVTVTDGRGETLTIGFDGVDRQTRVTAEDGSWTSFAYDGNGNLTERRTSTGQTTTYTYDKLNRRTAEDFPGTAFTNYGYDKAGNLTGLTDLFGAVTYAYDDVDRVRTIVSPRPGGGSDALSYAYTDPNATDAFSSRTATLPSGATQRIEQDLSGKVTDIVLRDRATTVLQRRTYAYLDGGAQRAVAQAVLDQADNVTAYEYDGVGRILRTETYDSTSSLTGSHSYTYDKAGNLTDADGIALAYNAANELCWRFDDASLINPSLYDCETPPAASSVDALLYTYDEAGQLTSGENALSWDRYGRLSRIGSSTLSHLSPTNGELVGNGSHTYTNNLFGQSSTSDGTTTTNLVRDPATGEAVSQTTGSDKRWYLTDTIGSTIALTDNAGTVTRSYAYDPYGTITAAGGSGPGAKLLYAGGVPVADSTTSTAPRTGTVYHFGARFYSTDVGRWSSLDPIEQYADLTQANRYSYAAGDPVNNVDPSGQLSTSRLIDLGLLAGGCATAGTGIGAGLCAAGIAKTSYDVGSDLSPSKKGNGKFDPPPLRPKCPCNIG